MLRLGGQILSAENANEMSSAVKGETIEDTIRVLNYYADAIVMHIFAEFAYARRFKPFCARRHFMMASVLCSSGSMISAVVTGMETAKVPTT